MNIDGFWWIVGFFVMVHLIIFIGVMVARKARLNDILVFFVGMLIALLFELGKALCTIALIGMFFIKDDKHVDSFTYALVWGIIFFGLGYYFNEKGEK